jgi:hypothetical protein
VILYVLTTCCYPFGFDGPKRRGGIHIQAVCENVRRGVDAVNFPESMSPELVELLRGTAPTPRWPLQQFQQFLAPTKQLPLTRFIFKFKLAE